MGKGASGDPSSSTTVSTSLPEYAEPFYKRLIERTEAESNRPYEGYGGQRVTSFSPEQQESFDIASEIGRSGVPSAARLGIMRAADAAAYEQPYDAGQLRADIAGSAYTPGSFGVGRFTDPGVAGQYMDPFVENVIDAQRRREERRFEEDVTPALAAQAVQQGAFGGSRAALQQGQARGRLDERLLDQDAALRSRAYQQAQAAYTTDATRILKEQQLSDAARQAATKFGLTGAELADRGAAEEARAGLAGEELGLRSAGELARLGGLEQQYGLRAADVLRQIGEQRRTLEQQYLDVGYSDFLSQRDYPRQQLGFYSGIMHGVPVSPSSETSVYRAPPDIGQQLLGYGLGGLGLAKQMG